MAASKSRRGAVPARTSAFNGVKVFSATMIADRAQLGEKASAWIAQHPTYSLVDMTVSQSSDSSFHCLAITIFYLEKLPSTMTHFLAIQNALQPSEAAMARAVAADLQPLELRAWFDDLSKLSVPEAVTKIRSMIAPGALHDRPAVQ